MQSRLETGAWVAKSRWAQGMGAVALKPRAACWRKVLEHRSKTPHLSLYSAIVYRLREQELSR